MLSLQCLENKQGNNCTFWPNLLIKKLIFSYDQKQNSATDLLIPGLKDTFSSQISALLSVSAFRLIAKFELSMSLGLVFLVNNLCALLIL